MRFNKKYDILEANKPAFRYAVARGVVPGWSSINKFGNNTDVDDVLEHVWTAGGVYEYPTEALAMEIVCDDAGDTAGSLASKRLKTRFDGEL